MRSSKIIAASVVCALVFGMSYVLPKDNILNVFDGAYGDPPPLPPWPYDMTEEEAANRTMLWVLNNVWISQPSAIDEYSEMYGTRNIVLNGYPLGAAYTLDSPRVVSTFNLTDEVYELNPNMYMPVRPFEVRESIVDKLQDLRGDGYLLGVSLSGAILNYSFDWPCGKGVEGGQGHAWAWSRAYNASQGVDCETMSHFSREYDFLNKTNINDMREAIDAVASYVDYLVFDEIFYWADVLNELDDDMYETWDPTATNWHPEAQQEFMSRFGYSTTELEWLRTWNGTGGDPYWPDQSEGNRKLYDDWVEFKEDVLVEWYQNLTSYAHSQNLSTALSVISPNGLDPEKHKADNLTRLMPYFDMFYAVSPYYEMGDRDSPDYYGAAALGETLTNNFDPLRQKKVYGAIPTHNPDGPFADPDRIAFNYFGQSYATHNGMIIFQLGDPGAIDYPPGEPLHGQWGNGWSGTAWFPSMNASAPYCNLAAREIPRFGPLVPKPLGDVALLEKTSGIPNYETRDSNSGYTYPWYYSNQRNLENLIDLLTTFTDISIVSEDSALNNFTKIVLATDYFPEGVNLSGKKVLGLGQPLWNSTADYCCFESGINWHYYYMSEEAEHFWGFYDGTHWGQPYPRAVMDKSNFNEIQGDINADGLDPFRQTVSRHANQIHLYDGTDALRKLLPPPTYMTGNSSFSRNGNSSIWDVVFYFETFSPYWATQFIRSDLRILGMYTHNDRNVTDGVYTLHFADWNHRQPIFSKNDEYWDKQFDWDGNMTQGAWAYKETNHISEFGNFWEARLRQYETLLVLSNRSANNRYSDAPVIYPPKTYVQNGSVDYGLILEAISAAPPPAGSGYVGILNLRMFNDSNVSISVSDLNCASPLYTCSWTIIDLNTGLRVYPILESQFAFIFWGVKDHHYLVTVERRSA